MRTTAGHKSSNSAGQVHPGSICDHPECALEGLYRAPRSPRRLNEYYWFCLDHVRAYNRSWNYCAGMGESEIENAIRAATCWERPTWRLGQWDSRRHLHTADGIGNAFGLFDDGTAPSGGATRSKRAAPQPAETEALKVLGLRLPIAWAAVKTRYRQLVKRLHPDANGGDKSAEERLKLVNQAYSTLKNRGRS